MDFFKNVLVAWENFNIGLAFVLFFAYLVVDGLYAKYTLHVMQYRAFSAATIGALMHFILAFGVLNYINNYLYVIPLALGSWVGTFIVISLEHKKS